MGDLPWSYTDFFLYSFTLSHITSLFKLYSKHVKIIKFDDTVSVKLIFYARQADGIYTCTMYI